MFLLLLLFFGSEKSVISKIAAFSPIKSLDFKKKKKEGKGLLQEHGTCPGSPWPWTAFRLLPKKGCWSKPLDLTS